MLYVSLTLCLLPIYLYYLLVSICTYLVLLSAPLPFISLYLSVILMIYFAIKQRHWITLDVFSIISLMMVGSLMSQ